MSGGLIMLIVIAVGVAVVAYFALKDGVL